MDILKTLWDYFISTPLINIPVLVFIIFASGEWVTSRLKKLVIYNNTETLANISIGAVSFTVDFLFSLVTVPILWYIYHHWQFITISDPSAWTFLLLFILIDLAEYWFHRLCHEINVLWLAHVIHHQGRFFNLSVGFRTSFFIPVFNIVLYIIFPVIGFIPTDILIIIFIQGFYQLLIHTEVISRLGPLEYIIVTPSSHRVHHGLNEKYIDKNYGKFFIIWDVIFGTYQKETEEVIYGVKEETKRAGAIGIVVKPFRDLILLFKSTESHKEKWKLLFKKPE